MYTFSQYQSYPNSTFQNRFPSWYHYNANEFDFLLQSHYKLLEHVYPVTL